ncbi:MAG: hypothetical protein ACU0FH_08920 [Heliomarina sp.]|uniref:hypothetical protein n=1 Tax=Heliomarina sp. TaxID=2917556 RepID=UPI0040590185
MLIDGPTYNNARGEASSLQMAPPFAFSDVTMTVFPLQANLARLSQFVDNYLNQAPEIVKFRPVLPFVYLIILDYGKMSAAAARTGWVSQREVAFGVPLAWMKPESGGQEFTFHDWAFTTPFIFVDNELSLSTGREVYGWPKLLARLDPSVDRWLTDPHGARQVFEIRSQSAADRMGDDLKAPFLSVTHTPMSGLTDIPTNLSSVTDALLNWPNNLAGMTRMARDSLTAFAEMRASRRPARDATPSTEGNSNTGLDNLIKTGSSMLNDPLAAFQSLREAFPKLYSNTINLKQFRDAEDAEMTCYQAITAAKMPIHRIGSGGVLGSENLFAGQFSGGYQIHMVNTTTVPVLQTLGLQAISTRDVQSGTISTLSPVMPFWIKIDMLYGKGQTLAWRSRHGDWKTTRGIQGVAKEASFQPTRLVTPPETGQSTKPLLSKTPEMRQIGRTNPFNTTRGASEAIGGTLRMPCAKIRVLPILANEEVLQKFVEDYINVPDQMRVEAWGRYVYLIIANYQQISADLNPSATTSGNEVTFSVPVKYYDATPGKDDALENVMPTFLLASKMGPQHLAQEERQEKWRKGANRLIGTGLISPFSYVDDIRLAVAESEVFGVPTLRSSISTPPSGWTAKGPDRGILAEVKAIMVPSLGTDAQGLQHSLVQVRDSPLLPEWDVDGWRNIAGSWGPLVQDDLARKFDETGVSPRAEGADPTAGDHLPFEGARSLALNILGGERGINTLSLKQFRDAGYPDKACYQGIVRETTRIDRLYDLSEIERSLSVSIARFPTQPVGKILGLIPKRTVATDHGMIDEFEPLRPFEINADLVREGGCTLFERVGDEPWTSVSVPEGLFGWNTENPAELDRLSKSKPAIAFSYVCSERNGDTQIVHAPRRLTEESMAAFRSDVEESGLVAIKTLNRARPIDTLCVADVVDGMDNGQIPDISTLVRTLKSQNGDVSGSLPLLKLAGALELVSPATIIDSLLNRHWGKADRPHPEIWIPRSDFRIRAESFGPSISQQLFPGLETQDGFWPPSDAHELQTIRLRVGHIMLLRFEFWSVINLFCGSDDESSETAQGFARYGDYLKECAEDKMPEWFKPVAEGVVPELVPMKGHVGEYWDLDMLTDLKESLLSFFDELEKQDMFDDDFRVWKTAWLRTVERLKHDYNPHIGHNEWPTGLTAVELLGERLTGLSLDTEDHISG